MEKKSDHSGLIVTPLCYQFKLTMQNYLISFWVISHCLDIGVDHIN